MTVGEELTKKIFELLRGSDGPLTAKQTALTALGSTSGKNIEKVTGAISRLKADAAVFEFPPERRGAGARFGVVSPTDLLAEGILSTVIKAGGRVTLSQARNGLRSWENPYFDGAIGKLVKEGRLFYLTLRYKYLLSSPPEPSDHLLPRQVTALREILERVNRYRKDALTIEELKTFLDGPKLIKTKSAKISGQPTEDLLREWYNKDLPKRGGLSSVPIPWTWQHYEAWCISTKTNPDPAYFKDFLWNLHRAGKIEFIAHSMTQSLTKKESEVSLSGQHGEVLYYWKWR